MDLLAVDPDDRAEALTFTVTNASNGWLALDGNVRQPVTRFTQADIDVGRVSFVHDGADGTRASFEVIVTDDDGATSGAAQTVSVAVLSK